MPNNHVLVPLKWSVRPSQQSRRPPRSQESQEKKLGHKMREAILRLFSEAKRELDQHRTNNHNKPAKGSATNGSHGRQQARKVKQGPMMAGLPWLHDALRKRAVAPAGSGGEERMLKRFIDTLVEEALSLSLSPGRDPAMSVEEEVLKRLSSEDVVSEELLGRILDRSENRMELDASEKRAAKTTTKPEDVLQGGGHSYSVIREGKKGYSPILDKNENRLKLEALKKKAGSRQGGVMDDESFSQIISNLGRHSKVMAQFVPFRAAKE